ncbi:hypothetical protein PS624_05998 [Pseudomonas fluorescens]|uniref:Uncharacterized protein n=1 Tax=Pseudomonas fluorescens TaxID=294 RepID=A0A5E6Y3R4_PSEFL|nr:hypothetical protein PS624_05998 [Pseudomonas fluorescens]
MQLFGGGFDGRHQFQIILDPLQRRHEQVQTPLAGLSAERSAGQPIGRFVDFRHAFINRRGFAVTVELRGIRQLGEILIRILLMDKRILGGFHPRLRTQRQAIAQRRISRHQTAVLITQIPAPALPLVALGGARQRQHLADHLVQTLTEDLAQACALKRLFQTRIFGADIARQRALAP